MVTQLLQRLGRLLQGRTKPTALSTRPRIVTRREHAISRENIHKNALKVLYRLKSAGYSAYLVGGGVRDLLLDIAPKDFDVATDAHPEQVADLFRNCRLIGRRFRLAHVYFKDGIVEVATFRAKDAEAADERHLTDTGLLLRDNVYGTLAEDALRRDFTVNALYYNIADFSVVDYTEGMQDLKRRLLRMIGDPMQRYREDPVRILRAIRLAAKLDFQIETNTEQPIKELGHLLQNVPPSRLYEEVIKLYVGGKASAVFEMLLKYNLFKVLFPQTLVSLEKEPSNLIFKNLLKHALINADERVATEKSLNPAFLFAVLLWQPLQEQIQTNINNGMLIFPAAVQAMEEVTRSQQESLTIPRRITTAMKEIWIFQYRLERRYGKRAYALLHHPRFRAAYDFLLLRAEAGEAVVELSEWWSSFIAGDDNQRAEMLKIMRSENKKPRRRRRY